MVEFLTAKKDLEFSWYPMWIKLDESGQLNNQIEEDISQPLTIKIKKANPTVACIMQCHP